MSSKSFVEGSRTLCVYKLNKWGYTKVSKSGSIIWTYGEDESSIGFESSLESEIPYFRLHYTVYRDEPIKRDYKVYINYTSCHYGGKRSWFICPLTIGGQACRRRVAKLHYGDTWYGCRYCMGLGYEKQYEYYGPNSFLLKGMARYWDADNALDDLRVKMWKGQPTKRVLRLLSKKARNAYAMEREIDIRNLL
jgi:hypothetical protein